MHISLGKLLRAAADSDPNRSREASTLRDCISNGELVPFETVMKYVSEQMDLNIEAKGIILDGFPRDTEQAQEFESKVRMRSKKLVGVFSLIR